MSRDEISKFMVYKFTVHCIVYSKLLILTSLQVCITLDSLQQIVVTYKSLTNQRAITLFALLLSQSVSYYTFALFTCTRNTLFGIYCTVVNGA